MAWDISYHWQQGGAHAEALETLLECADHLLWIGLAGDAANLLNMARSLATSPSELLDIKERECQAHHLAGRFDKQLLLYREVAELRAHSNVHPQHTNSELLALCARWRRNEDIAVLIASALQCVLAKDAPPTHQLGAARWAIIFADNACAKDVADQVYHIYRDRLLEHAEDDCASQELEMLYHTNMGDLDLGVEAARSLVTRLRERGNCVQLIAGLRNCSLVFHTAGATTEASSALLEAFDLSVGLRLAASARGIADTLCGRALQDGNLLVAHAWLRRAQSWNAGDDDAEGIRALSHLEARIALAEGDSARAKALLSPSLESILRDTIRRRQVAMLAYYARLAIATDRSSLDDNFCSTFENALHHVRSRSGQDGTVYALALSLFALGDSSRASEIVRTYLADYRRDRTAIPLALMEVSQRQAEDVLGNCYLRRALLGFSS